MASIETNAWGGESGHDVCALTAWAEADLSPTTSPRSPSPSRVCVLTVRAERSEAQTGTTVYGIAIESQVI